MVAAAIGVSAAAGLAGSAMSSSAASDAAQTQADAANNSTAMQNAQWQQTQRNLAPYMQLGKGSITPLLEAMGYKSLVAPDGSYNIYATDSNNPLMQSFTAPTAEQAQQTPGYQFTLDQGLKAVQNSAAARGLGSSGAALKGASQYATGLADSTYNDVFNRALQTFNTNYGTAANRVNRLSSLVNNGQNAAATNGSLGAQAMSGIGDTMMSGANASAAGRVGSANAIASGLSGVGNNALLYGMMNGPNNASGGSWSTNYNPSDSSTYFNNPAAYG